jgi:hypothetical protein
MPYKQTMNTIEEFVETLMKKGSHVSKSTSKDFMKYSNDKFDVIVHDNKVIVIDKRNAKHHVVYNNMSIAKAKLVNAI